MRRLGMLICAGCAVLLGCATRMPPGAPEAGAVAAAAAGPKSAEECDRTFEARLNAGDIEGLVALYEPSATLLRQDGTPATGTAAIRAEITALVALKPKIAMHVKKSIVAGDVVVLHNDWSATGTDPKGKRLKIAGRAVEVVRRQADGTWRFVIDDPDGRGRR